MKLSTNCMPVRWMSDSAILSGKKGRSRRRPSRKLSMVLSIYLAASPAVRSSLGHMYETRRPSSSQPM
jgi:hypothetical protein